MSQFACAADGRRIKGMASTAYAALVNGAYSSRKQQRFCPDHAQAFKFLLADQMELVWIDDSPQLSEDELQQTCRVCQGEANYTLFLDLFVRGEPSRAYRARFCDEHVGPVAHNASVEP